MQYERLLNPLGVKIWQEVTRMLVFSNLQSASLIFQILIEFFGMMKIFCICFFSNTAVTGNMQLLNTSETRQGHQGIDDVFSLINIKINEHRSLVATRSGQCSTKLSTLKELGATFFLSAFIPKHPVFCPLQPALDFVQ